MFIILAAHDSGHNLPEDQACKMRPVLLTCDLNGCAHTHTYIQFIHMPPINGHPTNTKKKLLIAHIKKEDTKK